MNDASAQNAANSAAAGENGKMMDLKDKIDKSQCYARNEDSRFPMSNLFIGDSRIGLKSDADEQLIIHIAFQEFVKVYSIKFTEFNLGAEPENAPTQVRIFANRCNLGFEDVDDVDCTQEIELTDEDLKEDSDPILLKYVKFQRIRSLTFYIEDNAGGDISSIGGLTIIGRTVATTNMADFKKTG